MQARIELHEVRTARMHRPNDQHAITDLATIGLVRNAKDAWMRRTAQAEIDDPDALMHQLQFSHHLW